MSRLEAAIADGSAAEILGESLDLLACARRWHPSPQSKLFLLRTLVVVATAARESGDVERAVVAYADAAKLARSSDSMRARVLLGGGSQIWLGRLATEQGDLAAARTRLNAAIVVCGETDDRSEVVGLARLMVLEASALLCAIELRSNDYGAALVALDLSHLIARSVCPDLDPVREIVTFAGDRLTEMAVEIGVTLSAASASYPATVLFDALAEWSKSRSLRRVTVASRWGQSMAAVQAQDLEAALAAAMEAAYTLDSGELSVQDAAIAGDLYELVGQLADQVGDHGVSALSHQLSLRHRLRAHRANDPRVLTSRYAVAELARVSGDVNEASVGLQALAEELRTDVRAGIVGLRSLVLKNLIFAFTEAGRFEEADAAYVELLALDPAPKIREQLLIWTSRRRKEREERDSLERELREALHHLPIASERIEMRVRRAQLMSALAHVVPDPEAYGLYARAITDLDGCETYNARTVRCDIAQSCALRLIQDGRFEEAHDVLARTLMTLVEVAIEVWRVGPANETSEWGAGWRAMFVELVVRHFCEDERAVRLAFMVAVSGKGGQAEALRFQREVAPTDATGTIDIHRLTNELRRQSAWDTAMPSLQVEALRELEGFMARSVSSTAYLLSVNRSQPGAVRGALPSESVVVEYVRYDISFDSGRRRTQSWYAAFVLRADDPQNSLHVHDLGSAEPIDLAVERLRAAIDRDGMPRPGWRRHARELARLIWDPVEADVGAPAWTFIAPDSALSAVPFDALVDHSAMPLLERHTFVLLGASRDAHRFRGHRKPPTPPVVMAAPDFGEPGWPFAPLHGAQAEGEEIARQLGVDPIVGAEASRQTLLDCQDAEILHLATHGYYLTAEVGTIAARQESSGKGGNILLASGLALAGANAHVRGEAGGPAVLTALDALGLNLGETDLVVLSACETGLGAPRAGEGLMSLARSFVLAGARTVVWTLWKVDDQGTADIMRRMYSAMLSGKPKAVALREAKLTAYREHPARVDIWAGIVLQGDPLPLLRHRDLDYAEDVRSEDLGVWLTEAP